MPKMYVTCNNCHGREIIHADVAEMFGINFNEFASKRVDQCPCCEGDLGKRN